MSVTQRNWSEFRSRYPYHSQTIAISAPFGAGCRSLIVSEPPPHATVAGMARVAPDLLSTRIVKSHLIGHDGWTKDVAFTIPPVDDRTLSDLIGYLHLYLFETAYKAHALDLSAPPPAKPENLTLDTSVSAAELGHWLLESGEQLTPVEGGPTTPFREVLEHGSPGVYFTASPGLVVWSIPKGKKLNDSTVEARQFALDTDLVIGAVASSSAVLVIGRERVAPLDLLPPMRVETLNLLASVGTDELAQSYERNHVFAGRLKDGKDWAPIYMSPEIIDTEYGSLLNITDQILKSWSMNGLTRYENFDYPRPARWMFDKPLAVQVSAQSILFNWNTEGLSGVVSSNGYDVFSLNGTGALMVSYGIDGDFAASAKYEELGHRFFSRSGDPNLSRAVQYTAMYQIFRRFELTADSARAPIATPEIDAILEDAAFRALYAITRIPSSVLDLDATQDRETNMWRLEIRDIREKLTEQSNDTFDMTLEKVAAAMALPRSAVKRLETSSRIGAFEWEFRKDEKAFLTALSLLEHNKDAIQSFVDIDQIKQSIVSTSIRRKGGWIHTPSVVISWNTGLAQSGIGGHNIGAATREVRLSNGVAPGEIQIHGSTIYINSADINNLSLGRNPVISKVPHPIRSKPLALGVPEARPDGPRGLKSTATQGLSQPPSRPSRRVEALADDVPPLPDAFSVTRRDGSYLVRRPGSREVIEASTMPDAIEQIARHMKGRAGGGKALQIELQGFNTDQARGFLRTSEIHSKSKVVGTIRNGKATDLTLLAECDFSKGKVTSAEYLAHADGTSAVHIAMEVPFKATPTLSLAMKLKVFFKKIVPETIKARLEQLTSRFIKNFSVQPTTTHDFAVELRNELMREMAPEGGEFQIHLSGQGDDIIILRRDTAEEPENGRATG